MVIPKMYIMPKFKVYGHKDWPGLQFGALPFSKQLQTGPSNNNTGSPGIWTVRILKLADINSVPSFLSLFTTFI